MVLADAEPAPVRRQEPPGELEPQPLCRVPRRKVGTNKDDPGPGRRSGTDKHICELFFIIIARRDVQRGADPSQRGAHRLLVVQVGQGLLHAGREVPD